MKEIPSSIRDRIVIALDVNSRKKALELVDALRGLVGMFKIGSQLFTAEGPQLVRQIVSRGERVFLDLKFHDIPNTVAKAGVEAARLRVTIFNVHALGGSQMMRRVVEETAAISARENIPQPAILGVTVLTSHDDEALQEIGIETNTSEAVVRLAILARDSGLDGVVASPLEIKLIRERIARSGFIVLTPGVRPAWSAADDQRRIMTPTEALRAGADYIVIGRPVTASDDPAAAAQRILSEIERTAISNE